MENEFLKKSRAEQPATVREKREFIANHHPLIQSIERGCELMSLPKSSYYYKSSKNKEVTDNTLISRIEEIAEEFGGYGYRRITAQLHREGINVNHKKVLRIMRKRGLLCKPKRRYIQTTDSNHQYSIYPNLLQDYTVTAINQVWVADITYIRILTAFVYLAVILDLFSRKAIGYAISSNIDTALSLEALRMAISNRTPPVCGSPSHTWVSNQHGPQG